MLKKIRKTRKTISILSINFVLVSLALPLSLVSCKTQYTKNGIIINNDLAPKALHPQNDREIIGYQTLTPAYEIYNHHLNVNATNWRYNTSNYKNNETVNKHYQYINDRTVKIIVKFWSTQYDKYNRPILNDSNGKPLQDPQDYYTENGTAWILDYLNEEDGSYPKTWFYATNLHVASRINFGTNGTLANEEQAYDRPKHVGPSKMPKNKDLKQETVILQRYKINKNKENPKANHQYYTPFAPSQVEPNIKLIFTARNFLGPELKLPIIHREPPTQNSKFRTYKDYFKDFAVIQVTYKDDEEAQEMTNDFYNKYKDKKTIFKEQSFLSQSPETLNKFNKGFVLGYPTKQNQNVILGGITINKTVGDNNDLTGSKLATSENTNIKNRWNQPIPGIGLAYRYNAPNLKYGSWNITKIDPDETKEKDNPTNQPLYRAKFNGVTSSRFGATVTYANDALPPGASGALATEVDEKGNDVIVGIQWGYNQDKAGLIDPLIFEGFQLNGIVISPKYDLINGGVLGQTKSFKENLAKTYPNRSSWLFGSLNKK